MASQVPYVGAPQVSPVDRPIPYRQVDTPLAAFGGATAAAISHLGQVEDSAGNEIFARGAAMQQLNQQAEANEAVAKYTIQLGQMHADLTSKMGKDAVDSYQPFIDQIGQTRQDIRDSLSSDFARRAFDQESRFMQARAVWSAAGHVGQQNKMYVVNASQARVDASASSALVAPLDDSSFQASLASTKSEMANQAQVMGWSPEKAQFESDKAVSRLWSSRIQGLAKSHPFMAQKLLDQASADGELQGSDMAQLSDYVAKQRYSVGARQLGSQVLSGNGNQFGEGIISAAQARIGIKGSEGGTYTTIGPNVTNSQGVIGHGLGQYQIMSYNLAPWLQEAGMQPMSEKEFLQNPAAQDQLFDFKFGQYMEKYGSANKAAQAWFGGEGSVGKDVHDINIHSSEYVTRFNAALARNAPLSSLVEAGRAAAAEHSPNDPLFPDFVTEKIEALHNQQIRVQRDDEFQNRQTVEGALIAGGQDGKIPTSVEELKSVSPQVEVAWNSMQASDQRKYMKVLASNAKGDVSWSPAGLRQYQQLRGEAYNDPEAFAQEDIVSLGLPISARKELINLQAQVYKQAGANPGVTHALQVMSPTLGQLGLTRTQDKTGFDQFTGAMHDAIQQFQTDHKKPPNDDEIRTIGARLLQQQGGGWFGWGSSELFRVPVPDDAAKIIREDQSWAKLGITPTDEQIQRIYVQKQYQQLYGGKPSAPPKPQVPRG